MRDGFPTETHMRMSSEEAHSLLGQRACALRERLSLPQNFVLSFEALFGFNIRKLNTWHSNYNNYFIT
jgi:hypothetical protein